MPVSFFLLNDALMPSDLAGGLLHMIASITSIHMIIIAIDDLSEHEAVSVGKFPKTGRTIYCVYLM